MSFTSFTSLFIFIGVRPFIKSGVILFFTSPPAVQRKAREAEYRLGKGQELLSDSPWAPHACVVNKNLFSIKLYLYYLFLQCRVMDKTEFV